MKTKACSMVRRAVFNGSLVPQPCEICGTVLKVEAHHDDYNEPLKVRWFCKEHHEVLHIGITTLPVKTETIQFMLRSMPRDLHLAIKIYCIQNSEKKYGNILHKYTTPAH